MNNIHILAFLLNHKEEQYTINQLAKILKMNYRIAHEHIKLLEKEGLVQTRRAGKALLCSLTKKYNEKIFLAEQKRREQLSKEFQTIRKRFEEARQNYILLLFGSIAQGKATITSDIDLLAITENEQEIKDISEDIPKKIHLTTTNYNTFISMLTTKEINVGNEAQKNNIILIGTEDYYRLLEHVNRQTYHRS